MERARLLIMLTLLTLLTLPFPGQAAAADPIREAMLKMVEVTYEPIRSPMIDKIYRASFYDGTIKLKTGDGGVSTSKVLLVRVGKEVFTLDDTSTTRSMPIFLTTIRKGFTITSDEDAAIFENTLDRLFPIEDGFGKDQKYKTIKRTAESVTFIRGAFFDNRKGFILTLGKDGSVTGISYSLEIAP